MMKRTVRLTESELKRVISESVKNILTEGIADKNLQKLIRLHGGIRTVSPEYQFDKTQFNRYDYFVSSYFDIPGPLRRFAKEIMVFNDGESLFLMIPEFAEDPTSQKAIDDYKKLINNRTEMGGYQSETKWEYDPDERGGGFTYEVSPNSVRKNKHFKSRGVKKPKAIGGTSSDYDKYVEKYLCDKYDGIIVHDYANRYIAVPGNYSHAVSADFRKYGYGYYELYPNEWGETSLYDHEDFKPGTNYEFYTKDKDMYRIEGDRTEGFKHFRRTRKVDSPKIGTEDFMKK